MTPQPTPRGTDMANLSERLREALSEFDDGNAERADDGEQPCEDIEVPAAWLRSCVRILDRLTVEGLAHQLGEAPTGPSIVTGAAKLTYAERLWVAGHLIDYITTPSVEESHD